MSCTTCLGPTSRSRPTSARPPLPGPTTALARYSKSVRISAACSSGTVEPSHVLTAIGLAQEDARATLRLSLGRQTTDEEIDFALEIIRALADELPVILV